MFKRQRKKSSESIIFIILLMVFQKFSDSTFV
jgi:hypothetical protein